MSPSVLCPPYPNPAFAPSPTGVFEKPTDLTSIIEIQGYGRGDRAWGVDHGADAIVPYRTAESEPPASTLTPTIWPRLLMPPAHDDGFSLACQRGLRSRHRRDEVQTEPYSIEHTDRGKQDDIPAHWGV